MGRRRRLGDPMCPLDRLRKPASTAVVTDGTASDDRSHVRRVRQRHVQHDHQRRGLHAGQPVRRRSDPVQPGTAVLPRRRLRVQRLRLAVLDVRVADPCDDRHRDGNESDVDCGGGVCPPCPAEPPVWHCNQDSDCQGELCHLVPNPVARFCTSSTCADARIDGDESDVDCGGSVCDACVRGQHCNSNFDCEGTTCTDGICGGECVCGARCFACSPGEACTFSDDCASHICDSGTGTCTTGPVQRRCDPESATETDVDCGGNLLAVFRSTRSVTQRRRTSASRRPATDFIQPLHHRRCAPSTGVTATRATSTAEAPACSSCPAGSAPAAATAIAAAIRRDAVAARVRPALVPRWDARRWRERRRLGGGACVSVSSIGAACRVDQDCASSCMRRRLTLRCVARRLRRPLEGRGAETSSDCGGACGSSCAPSADECQSDVAGLRRPHLRHDRPGLSRRRGARTACRTTARATSTAGRRHALSAR